VIRLQPCLVHGLDSASRSKALSSQGPGAFSFRARLRVSALKCLRAGTSPPKAPTMTPYSSQLRLPEPRRCLTLQHRLVADAHQQFGVGVPAETASASNHSASRMAGVKEFCFALTEEAGHRLNRCRLTHLSGGTMSKPAPSNPVNGLRLRGSVPCTDRIRFIFDNSSSG
jgi:hypothetical protein